MLSLCTTMLEATESLPAQIKPLLERSSSNTRPIVLMLCGIAGAGKSTLAKAVVEELPRFTRLSIDEILFEKHGLFGVDYPADHNLYEQYQDEADQIYLEHFHRLLRAEKDLVLDRSFYAKEDRDEFKRMIEDEGGRWILVYLEVDDKEYLWRRICARSAEARNANSALDISRELFETYWAGFEHPKGEGELTLDVSCPAN